MLRERLSWTIASLAIIGAAISIYLTIYSVDLQSGACTLSDYFSCSAVLSSSYSKFGGIPTASFGIVWFIVAATMCVWASRNEALLKYLLGWSLVGLLSVFILVYTEIFLVGAVCPLCTAVHILVIAILVLTICLWRSRPRGS